MEEIKYAIYPSLLDTYLRFKRHDDDDTFNAVFDKINKVHTEQTEQQLKGIEFEGLINAKIAGQELIPADDRRYYLSDNFQFKAELVNKIADKLQLATKSQEYLEAIIPSHLGNIKLYGIADYSFPEMIVDLKTTGNYKINKYKDNMQHPVYSLIKKLNGNPLKAFKYLATDFDNAYQETYIPTVNLHQKLMITIYDFIYFIEYFKNYITDEKIFGKERQAGSAIASSAYH